MIIITFSSTVDQRLETLWVLWIHHSDQRCIDPATSFDTIQAADDNLELHVVVFIFILNLANKRCDLDAFHSLLYKGSGNLCLWFANISLAEEELPVQVGDVDGVFSTRLAIDIQKTSGHNLPISIT